VLEGREVRWSVSDTTHFHLRTFVPLKTATITYRAQRPGMVRVTALVDGVRRQVRVTIRRLAYN